MFNPNIPPPNRGRRQQDPIVIADDEEDEEVESDYPEQIYIEGVEDDQDSLDRDLDDDDDDDDDDMQVEYSLQSSRPHSGIMGYTYPTTPTPHLGPTLYQTTLDQERQIRTRLREDRHAALCVLLDRELLTIQALAHQETLPQTRRRFLSRLLAPEDPESAASIRADRFTVQHPSTSSIASSSTVAMIVPRQVVDVHETDDAGWRRPMERAGRGGSVSAGAVRRLEHVDWARVSAKQIAATLSTRLSVEQDCCISNLLAFGNFPIAHKRALNIHRRQSLGWWRIRFRVERMQSVGSGEPDATIPHDW
ncbi:hypothetical protein CBS147346_5933 [Aspergillus niger]|nr:hypothetical protein CBS147346_5933 [Aspergillus niger]